MRSSAHRRDKYAAKVRGLVIPGQGERYKNNIMPRMKLEQCVKAAGITPMLQFSYVAFLEELLKHDAAHRPVEGLGIYRKWSNRGLDTALLTSVANCLSISVGEPPVPPCPGRYAVDGNTLALYYCDTGAGVVLVDETGVYNADFRAAGRPAWVSPGKCGSGAVDYGANDYVKQDTLLDVFPNNGSVECWFRPESNIGLVHGVIWLFYKLNDGANFIRIGWDTDDNRLALNLNIAGAMRWIFSTARAWNAGQWYHVCATWGASGMEIWIDGVRENFNAIFGKPGAGNLTWLAMGSDQNGNFDFNGLMDEIRFSDVQRTPLT